MSFGNFLIKQVVEELKAEFPQLDPLLDPVAGTGLPPLAQRQRAAAAAIRGRSAGPARDSSADGWCHDPERSGPLRA